MDKINETWSDVEVHPYNPSYSGDVDKEDQGLGPAWAKSY
jgi:hypothetical protein